MWCDETEWAELAGKMLRSSMPELAVEKSGLAKSKVSMNELGVDEEGKGLCDEAGLFCMVRSCAGVEARGHARS